MSREGDSAGGSAGGTGAGSGPAAGGYIFVRTGVLAATLVDTAKFPAQYQYTVTGRMRKRGTHGQLGTLVSINGKNVTLFRHRHLLYAVADRCSHQGLSPHPMVFSTPRTPAQRAHADPARLLRIPRPTC